MHIILLKDVAKVGDQYETVKVRDGFGNNFLIPQGLAVVANDSNTRKYASIIRALDKKELVRLSEYKLVAAEIDGKSITIISKAGDKGKLFGSVDAAQIAAAIQKQLNVTVDRKKIKTEAIKTLGEHEILVELHKEVVAKVKLEIAKGVGATA